MSESGKDDQYQQKQHQYGTFQGVHDNYPPPQHQHPVIGFPQPVPPPGMPGGPPANAYVHGYQSVPGYAVAEGRPVRERRLPCCGIGIGWLFSDIVLQAFS
ncbi:60S ribosomal protein L18a-like protein [Tanacetum coccineum]